MKPELQLISIYELTRTLQDSGSDMTVEEVLHWLRYHGYLVAVHGEQYNAPSDLCEKLGYMTRVRTYSESSGGGVLISLKPMFTKVGLDYVYPKLKRYSDTRHDLRD